MALAVANPPQSKQPFERLAALALPTAQIGPAAGCAVHDVVSDSRDVTPGCCFVATCGTQVDGHDFVDSAVAAGASVVVVERSVAVPDTVARVVVRDSRAALAKLTAAFHGLDALMARGALRVVGVTGTNGKTTVAYLLRQMLRESGEPTALIGTVEIDLVGRSFEAAMTTPPPIELTRMLVEAASHGASRAVMEVSSHALDQRRCDGVRFDAAVFTNLSGDHLDYHATTDEYIRAKKRLFDGLSRDATAIVNADDAVASAMVADCSARVVRFGFDAAADIRAERLEASAKGTRFRLITPERTDDIWFPFVGRHNVLNALAATGAALALGVTYDIVRATLFEASPVPGRLERIAGPEGAPTVLVDYAHTDDALANVLQAVRGLTPQKLWVVFGCGGDRDETKRPRMGRLAAELADEVIVTSDNPRTESPDRIFEHILAGIPKSRRDRVRVQPDRGAAIATAVRHARADDVVLLAGKGHETYQIVGNERLPFDDRVAAARALAGLEVHRRETNG